MAYEFALAVAMLTGAIVYLTRARSAAEAVGARRDASTPSPLDDLREAEVPELAGHRVYALCEIDRMETLRPHVGHAAVNRLLRSVAGVILNTVAKVEVGRSHRSSVEFAWLAEDRDSIASSLERLLLALPSCFYVADCELDVRPRVAFLQTDTRDVGESAFELLEAALADGSRHAEHLLHVDVEAIERGEGLTLLRELSRAITRDQLELHYQPKLDCRERRIVSAEALLRWTHTQLGRIAPDRIIAMAEETGLIRRLTAWVLNRVAADVRVLAKQDVAIPVYVNISGALLTSEAFAGSLLEQVRGVEHLIGLEITETSVIQDPDRALANLAAFRAAGINIAIDDYGSGLSSLAYLKQLPAQELKIDRLFISGLTSTHRDPLLVRSTIDLAHALEMKVTAEGVDNAMALSLLSVMGCDLAQGYLISPPLALDPFMEFLRRDSHVAHIEPTAPAAMFARG